MNQKATHQDIKNASSFPSIPIPLALHPPIPLHRPGVRTQSRLTQHIDTLRSVILAKAPRDEDALVVVEPEACEVDVEDEEDESGESEDRGEENGEEDEEVVGCWV